jgi:proteic killer suppression protein
VIVNFADKSLKRLANDDRKMLKELGKQRATLLRRRLSQLEDASTLEDIRYVPGNYHELNHDRKG